MTQTDSVTRCTHLERKETSVAFDSRANEQRLATHMTYVFCIFKNFRVKGLGSGFRALHFVRAYLAGFIAG